MTQPGASPGEALRRGKIWLTAHAIPCRWRLPRQGRCLTHQTPGRVMPSSPRDSPPGPAHSTLYPPSYPPCRDWSAAERAGHPRPTRHLTPATMPHHAADVRAGGDAVQLRRRRVRQRAHVAGISAQGATTARPSRRPPALILKPSRAGVESGLDAQLPDVLDVEGLHHDDVAVTPVPRWRRRTQEIRGTQVIGELEGSREGAGRCRRPPRPAPRSRKPGYRRQPSARNPSRWAHQGRTW